MVREERYVVKLDDGGVQLSLVLQEFEDFVLVLNHCEITGVAFINDLIIINGYNYL